MPVPILAPNESPRCDGFWALLDEIVILGFGGRLTAASIGHAAAVLVGVYLAHSMLEGETRANSLDTHSKLVLVEIDPWGNVVARP